MVQLKPAVGLMVAKIPAFQFHNGTIKTAKMGLIQYCVKDFNSIMVQLKPQTRKRHGTISFISIP